MAATRCAQSLPASWPKSHHRRINDGHRAPPRGRTGPAALKLPRTSTAKILRALKIPIDLYAKSPLFREAAGRNSWQSGEVRLTLNLSGLGRAWPGVAGGLYYFFAALAAKCGNTTPKITKNVYRARMQPPLRGKMRMPGLARVEN